MPMSLFGKTWFVGSDEVVGDKFVASVLNFAVLNDLHTFMSYDIGRVLRSISPAVHSSFS
jgi:hypothetical protein